ncbi:ComF family protein [Frigoribacterium sp. 2-23]|uniref:ComF family protein n=1 Tax=Frigoribacterium sp. 2-23 TaxID=3415006 RepID=UPI003C70485E
MPTSLRDPRLLRSFAAAVREATGVVSPRDCAGCGAADVALCDRCRERLHPAVTSERLLRGPLVVSGLRYEHEVREALLAFKQRGRVGLAAALAPALRAAVTQAASAATGPVVVVAVPSSRAGLRRRGYDPVELVAKAAGVPLERQVLSMARRRGPQKSLGRGARERSTHGSLRCRRPLDGLEVVIVDDVTTTGSTVVEAARAIGLAGGVVVAAACIASTPLGSARGRAHLGVDGSDRTGESPVQMNVL